MTVDEFKKKNKPKDRSVLDSFCNEIIDLRSQNFSLEVIKKFLSENGIETSIMNISKYLRRKKKQPLMAKEEKKETTIKAPRSHKNEETAVRTYEHEETDGFALKMRKTNNPILDYLTKDKK